MGAYFEIQKAMKNLGISNGLDAQATTTCPLPALSMISRATTHRLPPLPDRSCRNTDSIFENGPIFMRASGAKPGRNWLPI